MDEAIDAISTGGGTYTTSKYVSIGGTVSADQKVVTYTLPDDFPDIERVSEFYITTNNNTASSVMRIDMGGLTRLIKCALYNIPTTYNVLHLWTKDASKSTQYDYWAWATANSPVDGSINISATGKTITVDITNASLMSYLNNTSTISLVLPSSGTTLWAYYFE